jgi:hypothetical protein
MQTASNDNSPGLPVSPKLGINLTLYGYAVPAMAMAAKEGAASDIPTAIPQFPARQLRMPRLSEADPKLN